MRRAADAEFQDVDAENDVPLTCFSYPIRIILQVTNILFHTHR